MCNFCWDGPLPRCYECEFSFEVKGRYRNTELERPLNKCEFTCIFQDKGCNQICKLDKLREHMWSCEYRGNIIPLCKLFQGDDKCMIIPEIHSRDEIIRHFRNAHKVRIVTGSKFIIKLGIEAATGTIPDDHWSRKPVLVNIENNETGPLILIIWVAKRGVFSWMCVVVWAAAGDEDAFKYCANVSIRNVHEENRREVWSPEVVVDIKTAMEYLNTKKYRCYIAINELMSSHVKDGTAFISVTLKRKDLVADVLDLPSEDAINFEEMNGPGPNGLSGRSTLPVIKLVLGSMTNGTGRQRHSQALGESSEPVASTSSGLDNKSGMSTSAMPQPHKLKCGRTLRPRISKGSSFN
ncbi:unnamed protein product [Orchesella dallaii]